MHRVVFYEITKNAIRAAIAAAARTVAWTWSTRSRRGARSTTWSASICRRCCGRRSRQGLSAGRVQSPALRMICEREEEIDAFKAREYWTIDAEGEHSEHDASR